MAQMQKQEKEFTVSTDKLEANRKEYFRRKGFFYYLMRWVPLLVIAVVAGLLIAHLRGYPVYEKILIPAMVKMGIPLPQEEGSTPEPSADTPPADASPTEVPPGEGEDPSMNLPLPGEMNED